MYSKYKIIYKYREIDEIFEFCDSRTRRKPDWFHSPFVMWVKLLSDSLKFQVTVFSPSFTVQSEKKVAFIFV